MILLFHIELVVKVWAAVLRTYSEGKKTEKMRSFATTRDVRLGRVISFHIELVSRD
jgi:hypothetical protein